MLWRVTDHDRAAELGSALQARLAELHFPLTAPTEGDVHRHVCDYVAELKGLGMPPERVLMAVKYMANQAGIYATPRLLFTEDRPLEGTDKLLVDLVAWSIKEYYRPGQADGEG
jgi:hypothetical protein